MSRILFFIGMSGAGKTEWGKAVAEAYGLPFFDTDQVVEAAEGATIAQIFGKKGEAYFRQKESAALRTIIEDPPKPFVCSTGGGTPVDPANMALMKQHGIIVFLKAKISTLVANLQGEAEQRPLLDGFVSVTARLRELYEKRKHIYLQAHYTVNVEMLSLQELEPIIRQCIGQPS